ncbi:E2F/DP winged-helix DNA-binding domain [Castilleja foliolosa]|uniref:E2F/DP winged-helix DNA-binding domain n=1 Tax=Castilleja foliolosa TaxID=1961234 RepID=A0ABD3DR48_9LAMI
MTDIDPSVYASYYWVSSQYHKSGQEFAEFYRSALLYLAYTSVDSLSGSFKLILLLFLNMRVWHPKLVTTERKKSLGLLTQNFVKLFLYTDMDMISLDDAAKLSLGDGKHTSMTTRRNLPSPSKVRKLYDIANVLSSMKFIEKTHHPETRKTAFRWLGLNGKPQNGVPNNSGSTESKKRVSGADITNVAAKRFKVDEDANHILKPHNPTRVKHETESEDERTRMAVKGYHYGPFAPANVPKVGVTPDERGKQGVDWESLASAYRPQYHNQALKDLFSHYVEAWKSWYSEVDDKSPLIWKAVDVKQLSSLNRNDIKKICGETFPQWISFPVYEQVKWLNKQLSKLWPFIADAAEAIIKETIVRRISASRNYFTQVEQIVSWNCGSPKIEG